MKFMILLFTALLLHIDHIQAQASKGITIEVTVENVLTDRRNILATLHTEETFMKNKGVASAFVEGKKGTVSFSFNNVQPGTYAIMVLHDLNGNHQIDFEANGMPKENFGISGDEILMGPPIFENCKFEVADKALHLQIRF